MAEQLDYRSYVPPSPERFELWGSSSLVVGVVFGLLALVAFGLLEVLVLFFYGFAAVFLIGAGLGLTGLLRDGKRMRAALGVLINIGAGAWKCTSLYWAMRDCSAHGWMTMPFPFQ